MKCVHDVVCGQLRVLSDECGHASVSAHIAHSALTVYMAFSESTVHVQPECANNSVNDYLAYSVMRVYMALSVISRASAGTPVSFCD